MSAPAATPVPAADRPPSRATTGGGSAPGIVDNAPARQMSLFDAEAAATRPGDLEGLLAGPGQVVRMGGTARVSIIVREPWRARALLAEFAERGLSGAQAPSADEHIGVRTEFAVALAPLAARWLKGAVMQPPRDFALDGPRLRLWFIAAGRLAPRWLSLQLPGVDEAVWRPVRSALARLGMPAALLGARAGGPAYRIMGRRRLAQFGELIGAPPGDAPAGAWPAVPGLTSNAIRRNAGA